MIRYFWTNDKHVIFTNSSFFDLFQKFFCGGRLVFGPDVASLFLTTFLIAGPAIAFCLKIYLKINKGIDISYNVPILIVGAVITVLVNTLGSLFLESLHKLVFNLCILFVFFPSASSFFSYKIENQFFNMHSYIQTGLSNA